MTRAIPLLLILLPACADTQSGRAFTPRAPAAVEIHVDTPNRSAERSHDLADALERSLAAQEDQDEALPVPPPAQRDEVAPVAADGQPSNETAARQPANEAFGRADRTPLAAYR
jgi:hypothetical protein